MRCYRRGTQRLVEILPPQRHDLLRMPVEILSPHASEHVAKIERDVARRRVEKLVKNGSPKT